MRYILCSIEDSLAHRPIGNPGVRLCRALAKEWDAEIIDAPSSVRGLISWSTWRRIWRAIAFIVHHREGTWVIYNLPMLYVWPLLFISRRSRVLLLADGANCVFLRTCPYLYRRLFRRFVLLNSTAARYLRLGPSEYVVLNGVLAREERALQAGRKVDLASPVLLYNSASLKYNGPDLVASLRSQSVTIISTAELNSSSPAIRCLGYVSEWHYSELLRTVWAILVARDPAHFENAFNFPSKVIEAAELGIEVVSLFPLEDIPSCSYMLCKSVVLDDSFVAALRNRVATAQSKAIVDHVRRQMNRAKQFLSC